MRPTRRLCANHTQTSSYLALLCAEFSCFHSISLPFLPPVPDKKDQCFWTFSLFHWSSPYGGGALPLALLYKVRTFLQGLKDPQRSPFKLKFSKINLKNMQKASKRIFQPVAKFMTRTKSI